METIAIAKQQQGFISIHFIISPDESEYGSFSLWESQDHAETGGGAIRSQLAETLQDLAAASTSERLLGSVLNFKRRAYIIFSPLV